VDLYGHLEEVSAAMLPWKRFYVYDFERLLRVISSLHNSRTKWTIATQEYGWTVEYAILDGMKDVEGGG
jgi:hypothetical protein